MRSISVLRPFYKAQIQGQVFEGQSGLVISHVFPCSLLCGWKFLRQASELASGNAEKTVDLTDVNLSSSILSLILHKQEIICNYSKLDSKQLWKYYKY